MGVIFAHQDFDQRFYNRKATPHRIRKRYESGYIADYLLTVITAKNTPSADPAKTSHQWCRWSVMRDTEHRQAQNKHKTCSKSKRNWLRMRGIRRCKYLEKLRNGFCLVGKFVAHIVSSNLPYHENCLEETDRRMARREWLGTVADEKLFVDCIRAGVLGDKFTEIEQRKHIAFEIRSRSKIQLGLPSRAIEKCIRLACV